MIALHEPDISGNEWLYVKECLDTGWVSSAGKYVDLFEDKISQYTGSKYAVACVNGTSALQISIKLAGVQPGDEVLVPSLTFIAPVNAVRYNGAEPVFMDADEYYNIDPKKTLDFINKETVYRGGFTYNKHTNLRITAIIPVHVFGNAVRLDELFQICEERNIVVVEDASESLGTSYTNGNFSGKHTGTIGKLGCLSFNGNKIITAGGGGMILMDDENLFDKARYFTTQAKNDSVRYVHNEIGYNFRLTNIQAALGVAQLENISEVLNRKKDIREKYLSSIKDVCGLSIGSVPQYAHNNYWLNILKIDPIVYDRNRDDLMADLNAQGIETRPVWYPNHKQRPYIQCQSYGIENALSLIDNTLLLPSGPGIKDSQIEVIIKHLNNNYLN